MDPSKINKPDQDETEPNAKKPKSGTPIGPFNSVEEFTKNGFAELVNATKAINAFPQGAVRDLYCAYPTFGKIIDLQAENILGCISKVLKRENVKGNIERRQQDEQFDMLLECNDVILERLSTNLDEMAGIKKPPQPVLLETSAQTTSFGAAAVGRGAGSWNVRRDVGHAGNSLQTQNKNIPRPQLKFQQPVDNSAANPFIPKLKEKPNSLKPLAVLPEYDEDGNVVSYLHPYEFELMKFKPQPSQLKRKNAQPPPETFTTELMYVDTVPKLRTALEELRQYTEIAVDVEHHSYRSFLGFTCLVQVSTRSKDYIFDALELRDDMHTLNEVFTDPRIVKIFHGGDMDIEWLQRDLSIYVVNMFDTHQAAKILNFARLSLAFLLKHYCDVEADKSLQLADWRLRPLTQSLIDYARQDTHFLIYIYERLTNELLDNSTQQANLLECVYQRSTEVCKRRYSKPAVGPNSYMDVFRKSKRNFDNRQLTAFQGIFNWRDSIARQEDESYGYVLPNHMMLQIAETLPREMQGILACCNPIPPLVRQHLHTLHQIVLRSRGQPLIKPIMAPLPVEVLTSSDPNVKGYNSKLYCVHDLTHTEEFRDDLPTLLDPQNPLILEQPKKDMTLVKPAFSIFEPKPLTQKQIELANKVFEVAKTIRFASPYQRYLAILPQAEKEKQEEMLRLEAEAKRKVLCPESPVVIKKEPGEVTVKEEVLDPAYETSVKEYLKNCYEKSVSQKRMATNTSTNSQPPSKRSRRETVNSTTTTTQASNGSHMVSNDDSDGPPDEMPSTSKASANRQEQNKKNFRNKNRNKNRKCQKQQSSDRPVQTNFDYKNVDFKKFQGGAQRAKGMELKPQFHGKNKPNKATNKKFNKLFTFSNVQGKKK